MAKKSYFIRVMKMTEVCDLQLKADNGDEANEMALEMALKGKLEGHFKEMTDEDKAYLHYLVVQPDFERQEEGEGQLLQ